MASRRKLNAFYQNKTIEAFAQQRSTPISLKHLINFGVYGRNKGEKEEAEKLVKSGNFLRTELPTRLSHRLRDMQSLPFVVTSHPRIEKVYDMYFDAFEGIRRFPVIKDLDDNDKFCALLQSTLDDHRIIIPELAVGVAETSPVHLPPPALDIFMTRMLRSRLSRRVVAEQHISLTSQFRERQRRGKGEDKADDQRVGVVDVVYPAKIVEQCVELIKARGGPEGSVPVRLEGQLATSLNYIPEHLEFMVLELLKFSAFATTKFRGAEHAKDHPIVVTIVDGPKELQIRVSDEGGGIPAWGGLPDPVVGGVGGMEGLVPSRPPTLLSERLEIFSFSHMRRLYLASASLSDVETGIQALRAVKKMAGTVQEQLMDSKSGEKETREAARALFDLQVKSGIGLPLALMFTEYFGGSLKIHTLLGHGSDAFLCVSKIGHAA